MDNTIDLISKIGIVPVIKLENASDAVPLAEALSKGGLPLAEITFRTDAAEESIRLISKALPHVLVGVGTVTEIEQVDRAISAGAKFIVSPGFNPKIVAYCLQKKITVTPGCTTPSEIEAAMELGVNVLKFFPAEQSGGLAKIKALCAPYTKVQFIPTGGIDLQNLNTYLANDRVVACGGTFMIKDEYIKAKEFDKITQLTKNAVDSMLGFSIAHVGINALNEDDASQVAGKFAQIFSLGVKDGNSSLFAGSALEVMKSPYLGKNGHIAMYVSSIERAKYHMEARGVKFNEGSLKKDGACKSVAIYLQEELGGFALHLVKRS